jgi:iron complex transport system permease protein
MNATIEQNGKNRGIQQYEKQNKKRRYIFVFLLFTLLFLTMYSLSLGSYDISVRSIIAVFLNTNNVNADKVVILSIRLPRVVAAIVAGAGLSVSGCIMQNNLNNPLASPSTLGISPAATFGANFAIIFFSAGSISSTMSSSVVISNPYLVTICAFSFSMITVGLILFISKAMRFNPSSIILAGVALSSLYTAGTTILQYFANEDEITKAVFWTFGDLSRIKWSEILILSVIVVSSIGYFVFKQSDYNTIAVGDDVAKSLGVNSYKTRIIGLVISSLITAVTVSFLGLIGFVGLLGPHVMKKIVGSNHLYLIPSSALFGSILLVSADLVARNVIAPVTLPVGAITSLLGGVVFLMILFGKDSVR